MKTCKVNAEIIEEHSDSYRIVITGPGGGTWTATVPKSAVTDIREKVDWSKVKSGEPVVDKLDTRVWFFMRHNGCRVEVVHAYNDIAKEISHMALHVDNAMLLTDWLKEHGGEAGGNENG